MTQSLTYQAEEIAVRLHGHQRQRCQPGHYLDYFPCWLGVTELVATIAKASMTNPSEYVLLRVHAGSQWAWLGPHVSPPATEWISRKNGKSARGFMNHNQRGGQCFLG